MSWLVTGAAGFIGYHVSQRLLARGETVLGVDNLNAYYDPALKQARLECLARHQAFTFRRLDISDRAAVEGLFANAPPRGVIHLAAQAGVRHSIIDPHPYVASNLTGFLHILEGCRRAQVKHLVFASTSSVYGLNERLPFSPHDGTQHPVSLYAATKQANELMAHAYAHLYGIPCTGLRYFTVYGPWGRPDMALFKWTEAILSGHPIEVFNYGEMRRDFTYVEDVAEITVSVADRPPAPDISWNAQRPDPASSSAPYRLFNVARGEPASLEAYIEALEQALGRRAERRLQPMQDGDVPATAADISDLAAAIGQQPSTSIQEGVRRFVEWYRAYRGTGAPCPPAVSEE